MSSRPQLKPKLSAKAFRDKIAEMATDFSRFIELSVDAFPSDPAAKAERLERVGQPDGFEFFMETYLPHYVKGEASLFHQAIFARVPEILASNKEMAGAAFDNALDELEREAKDIAELAEKLEAEKAAAVDRAEKAEDRLAKAQADHDAALSQAMAEARKTIDEQKALIERLQTAAAKASKPTKSG